MLWLSFKRTKTEAHEPSPDEARRQAKMVNSVSLALFFVILTASVVAGVVLGEVLGVADGWVGLLIGVATLIGFYVLFGLKIADQWEKAVVLRFGRYAGLRGPGQFWIVPIVDTIPRWIDHRVMVTPFNAEKTLTRDTVPVDVDAVLFWMVWDAEKASLEVEDYRTAIAWAAQTALREIIGQMGLADILVGRARMDADLQKIIDARTTPWGVTVQSVEIRGVLIPDFGQAQREQVGRPGGDFEPRPPIVDDSHLALKAVLARLFRDVEVQAGVAAAPRHLPRKRPDLFARMVAQQLHQLCRF